MNKYVDKLRAPFILSLFSSIIYEFLIKPTLLKTNIISLKIPFTSILIGVLIFLILAEIQSVSEEPEYMKYFNDLDLKQIDDIKSELKEVRDARSKLIIDPNRYAREIAVYNSRIDKLLRESRKIEDRIRERKRYKTMMLKHMMR